jgi:hypothetical protein
LALLRQMQTARILHLAYHVMIGLCFIVGWSQVGEFLVEPGGGTD